MFEKQHFNAGFCFSLVGIVPQSMHSQLRCCQIGIQILFCNAIFIGILATSLSYHMIRAECQSSFFPCVALNHPSLIVLPSTVSLLLRSRIATLMRMLRCIRNVKQPTVHACLLVWSNAHAKFVVSTKLQTVVSTNSTWLDAGRKNTTSRYTSVKQNLLVSDLVHEGGGRATNTASNFQCNQIRTERFESKFVMQANVSSKMNISIACKCLD